MAIKDDTDVELRGTVPRTVADVLDAVSQSKRISRIELVNRILRSYVVEKINEHTLIERITRGNPPLSDTVSGGLE